MPKIARQEGEAERIGAGTRIRELRQRIEMSMEDLATAAGCSRAFLSRVERNEALPSLPTLLAIAAALRIGPGQLLSSTEAAEAAVVRHADQPRAEGAGVAIDQLTHDAPIRRMQMIRVTVQPRQAFDRRLQRYDEDQCALCVSGEGRLVLERRSLALQEGDTYYLRTPGAYRIENVGAVDLVLVLCSSRRGE